MGNWSHAEKSIKQYHRKKVGRGRSWLVPVLDEGVDAGRLIRAEIGGAGEQRRVVAATRTRERRDGPRCRNKESERAARDRHIRLRGNSFFFPSLLCHFKICPRLVWPLSFATLYSPNLIICPFYFFASHLRIKTKLDDTTDQTLAKKGMESHFSASLLTPGRGSTLAGHRPRRSPLHVSQHRGTSPVIAAPPPLGLHLYPAAVAQHLSSEAARYPRRHIEMKWRCSVYLGEVHVGRSEDSKGMRNGS
jgi:hypothetical protein